MRQQLLAGAMIVSFATALTTSAMASGHGARRGFHAGYSGLRGTHAGIRSGGPGQGRSGRRFVSDYRCAYYEGIAPFGRAVGFGPGYGTCSPHDYGYCGSTFSVGW